MDAKPLPHTLEITVISGEDISVDRNPTAENVYVVVRPESINCYTTEMVKGEEGLHAWNEKFLLDIPMHAKSITFEVQCKKYKGLHPIGVARIALSELVGGEGKESNCIQMFSYGLRDWDGRRNGVIHFSMRIAATAMEDCSCLDVNHVKGGIKKVSSCGSEHQVMGFQVHKMNSKDVVIGNPVWWSNPSKI
ncbi:hypothetical protein TanjilG_14591 [Lupinus angustifolius]|uniref:C2 domain-containing protein n=1 Tax=Lupinus angustifolius TaxID=3871 RepID=A0A1J7GNR7_LUPAN|nr:PREDICTED: uncharacterized protein LOC109360070 [Lupinus angustifolius]OIW02068.1 hypothetical protein TanjilG_14591 [Lupinus angustifolius]